MTSLVDFAITDRQREVIKLVEAKSQTAAAKELGLSTGTVSEMVKRVRRYAASKCWQPDRDAETPLVDGMFLKGLTTYYKIDEEGNRQARGQHVIQRADTNQLVEFSRQLAENISSTVKPIKPRKAPVHKLSTRSGMRTSACTAGARMLRKTGTVIRLRMCSCPHTRRSLTAHPAHRRH
jgi:hypothetical protein